MENNKEIKICDLSDFRMDFEFIHFYEKPNDNSLYVISTPNKERYELTEIDGVAGYWDKFDNCFFPLSLCQKIGEGMVGQPIITPSSRIDDVETYFYERYENFEKYFLNDVEYDFSTSEQELNKLDEGEKFFNFISIDIVDSTIRSRSLDSKTNSIINRLFLNEVAEIIRRFDGCIFKFEGDGLIAYFTSDNLLSKIDNSLECVSIIKLFIEKGINSFLEKKEMPKIYFRIGVNCGLGYISNVGAKNEIYSYDLNATCKLQKFAKNNQIIVGSSSVKLAHTMWRQKLKKIKINKRNLRKSGLDDKMEIYKLKV